MFVSLILILNQNKLLCRTVINDMQLDGCQLPPRKTYPHSFHQPLAHFMDDPTPTSQDHLENGLNSLPSKRGDANYV